MPLICFRRVHDGALAEVDYFYASKLPAARPNSMNNYGAGRDLGRKHEKEVGDDATAWTRIDASSTTSASSCGSLQRLRIAARAGTVFLGWRPGRPGDGLRLDTCVRRGNIGPTRTVIWTCTPTTRTVGDSALKFEFYVASMARTRQLSPRSDVQRLPGAGLRGVWFGVLGHDRRGGPPLPQAHVPS